MFVAPPLKLEKKRMQTVTMEEDEDMEEAEN